MKQLFCDVTAQKINQVQFLIKQRPSDIVFFQLTSVLALSEEKLKLIMDPPLLIYWIYTTVYLSICP